MIEFSKLSKQEKDKYMQFLMTNNIEFQQSEQGFTASFKVQNKENVDPSRKSLDLSTKKINDYQQKKSSPLLRTPTRSISPLKKKITKEDAYNLIQEIYTKKFEDASIQIKKKNVKAEDFGVYVMKFAQNKQVDIKECMLIDDENVKLFKKFLSKEYEEEDLMYFLFVRAIVEKEIQSNIYQSRNSLDIQREFLTFDQVESILIAVYENQDDQIQDLIDYSQHQFNNGKISIFDFLNLALQKYHQNRKPQDIKEIITHEILKELKTFLIKEIQDINEEQLEQVKEITNDLLNSIFKQDKRIWINKISNPKPEEIIYLENLQKLFLKLTLTQNKNDIQQFRKKVLHTPSLVKRLAILFE